MQKASAIRKYKKAQHLWIKTIDAALLLFD